MRVAKLRALVESFGGTLRINSARHIEYCAEAPEGKVWIEGGVHELVSAGFDAESPIETRKALAELVRYGVEPCPDCANCDWCCSARYVPDA